MDPRPEFVLVTAEEQPKIVQFENPSLSITLLVSLNPFSV